MIVPGNFVIKILFYCIKIRLSNNWLKIGRNWKQNVEFCCLPLKQLLTGCKLSENSYFCTELQSIDMPKKKLSESEVLTREIIKGIQEKKGKKILSMNLMKLPNAVSDFFVICSGNSNTQVEAIADSIEEMVRKATGDKPWHKEGFENAEWILLDYVTVVVHIFQEESRAFYNLEKLWDDAEIIELDSD
jgi:ribosome-associated protein